MADADFAARYLPFWIAGEILGRVRRDLAPALLEAGAVGQAELGLMLRDAGFSNPRRSRLLQSLAVQLRGRGLIADWRNELCSVLNAAGEEVARCERGAFRTLGIQNRAVHVHGYLADGRKAFQDGHYERARRSFQDAQKLSPSSQQMAEIQSFLSRIDQQLEQSRQASASSGALAFQCDRRHSSN